MPTIAVNKYPFVGDEIEFTCTSQVQRWPVEFSLFVYDVWKQVEKRILSCAVASANEFYFLLKMFILQCHKVQNNRRVGRWSFL
jgi:hypothetical protein